MSNSLVIEGIMHRERVSENVYWFQSEIYAQVTAGVVIGPQMAVVIDTLAIPEETLAMRAFIVDTIKVPVRYVINTHYHADHTWGNCFFPEATILAHTLCRESIKQHGQVALDGSKRQNPVFKNIKIVLPHLTFHQGELSLRVGKKRLVIFPTPGHSNDGISVLVEEDRVLFAGDAFLPVPYIVDGNIDDSINTIKTISKMGLENIVQGHGDIILRGEVDDAVHENLTYLNTLRKVIKTSLKRKDPIDYLESMDIESCGKNRVYLGGLAEDLHRNNLRHLFHHYTGETIEDNEVI